MKKDETRYTQKLSCICYLLHNFFLIESAMRMTNLHIYFDLITLIE
jgi:hypothetical protein